MRTYIHTLTPLETACGVSLAEVADALPKVLFIDNGHAVMVPAGLPPAMAGSVARCAFGAPADFSHLSNGYPVYTRRTL